MPLIGLNLQSKLNAINSTLYFATVYFYFLRVPIKIQQLFCNKFTILKSKTYRECQQFGIHLHVNIMCTNLHRFIEDNKIFVIQQVFTDSGWTIWLHILFWRNISWSRIFLSWLQGFYWGNKLLTWGNKRKKWCIEWLHQGISRFWKYEYFPITRSS